MCELINEDLFELTLAKVCPKEPITELKRPVARVKYLERNLMDSREISNLPHLGQKLREQEKPRPLHLQKSAFQREMEISSARLQKVKGGASYFHLINQPIKQYELLKSPLKYDSIEKALNIPKKEILLPRKSQFIYPVTSRRENINLIDRIQNSTNQDLGLRKLSRDFAELEVQAANDSIRNMNFINQRKMRASATFFEDLNKYGLKKAQIRARRATQKSRLRMLSNHEWWNEFLDFAYSKNVGSVEEKCIIEISRQPAITGSWLVNTMRRLIKHTRCIDYLNWINNKCQIINPATLQLLITDNNENDDTLPQKNVKVN